MVPSTPNGLGRRCPQRAAGELAEDVILTARWGQRRPAAWPNRIPICRSATTDIRKWFARWFRYSQLLGAKCPVTGSARRL